jgi:hypothetical protein
VRQTVGTGSRAYSAALAGVWLDLRPTLADLDALAAEPLLLDEDETLRALQYELHAATEMLAGIAPPEDAGAYHDEFGDALADARDATAEVFEVNAACGAEGVLPLVWEWRGALFRVRYAHRRLGGAQLPSPPRHAAAQPAARTPPSITAAVVGLGSALVLASALMGMWAVVAVSLSATLAASLLLRP